MNKIFFFILLLFLATISFVSANVCFESDGGLDYYTKGFVVPDKTKIKLWDECRGDVLTENYCSTDANGSKVALTEEYTCPGGCENGACISNEIIKEVTECIFLGSSSLQKCFSISGIGRCSGIESCIAEIQGKKEEKITWESSCGGLAYTTIDGKKESIKFDCSQIPEEQQQDEWFRKAYWSCHDGTTKEEGIESSCKPPQVWKKYAEDFCKDKCNSETGNCGVNNFGVYKPCKAKFVEGLIKNVCGNGICEANEEKVCYGGEIICRNENCISSPKKCEYACPQDCDNQKEVQAKPNENFKLSIGQTAKIDGYSMFIHFKEFNINECKNEPPSLSPSQEENEKIKNTRFLSVKKYDGITGKSITQPSFFINEFSFIKAKPLNRPLIERINSARVKEPFALYGEIDSVGELHYVEYIMPQGCTFENSQPSPGFGGEFVEGSQTKKVFQSKKAHEFRFDFFTCHSAGTYTFQLKLYNSKNQEIASKTEQIKIKEAGDQTICFDSDFDIDPYLKGTCKDASGAVKEDYCIGKDGTGPADEGDYVVEAFCLTPEMIEYCKKVSIESSPEYCQNLFAGCQVAPLIPKDLQGPNWKYFPPSKKYFCPNGCKNGVCLPPQQPACNNEPYAIIEAKYKKLSDKKLKTEIIKIQIGEKKKVGDMTISFLDFDADLKKGMFYVSTNEEFECPQNCRCDINNNKIVCLGGEEQCPNGTRLCPNGECRAVCVIPENIPCDSGCYYNKKCLPFGIRINDFYCSLNGNMKSQLLSGESCENNFECKSNLCVSGECTDQGLFKKIMDWFRNMFGS